MPITYSVCEDEIKSLKKNFFFMIFQGLSVARNSLRLEITLLTILDIKGGLLCNFPKHFKGSHFMGQSCTDFPLLMNSKSSKFPSIVF